MSLLLLFIDGLGLGEREGNPLFEAGAQVLALGPDIERSYRYRGAVARAVDSTMGVDGLPQSATGQTAIFTGVNTSRLLGRHLSGWPSPRLRGLLKRDSVFLRLRSAGKRAVFANAFTPAYFLRPVNRMSASTLHMLYAGLRPRWIWQIDTGGAVFQDFTNRMLIESGFDISERTPEQAGAGLAAFLQRYDFTLYEFFLTDAAAHRRVRMQPVEVLGMLGRMLDALLEAADLDRHCVAICSDHGNIEDSSTRSHTRNPVPLLAWGKGAEGVFAGVEDITGIAPAVVRLLTGLRRAEADS